MKNGRRSLRSAVWWSVGSRVSLALLLALCASAGIRIPAQDIAAVRVERRFARGKLAAADDCAELSQGGQTTVTVRLTRPVTFTRPLGKPACASTFCFYAAAPAAAAAAIRARVPALQTSPSR